MAKPGPHHTSIAQIVAVNNYGKSEKQWKLLCIKDKRYFLGEQQYKKRKGQEMYKSGPGLAMK